MSTPLVILAAGDDTSVKLIIGVIVFIGWIIAQVYNAITKTPDKRVPPPKPKRPQPLPSRPLPQDVVPPYPKRTPPQRTKRVRQQPQPQPQVQPYVPPVRPTLAKPVAAPQVARPMSQGRMVNALLRPQNLKKAYILNEILQPPVSMRSPDDRRPA